MTTTPHVPRVLLLAEACNPEWTSVPLLAYYWYCALSKHVDVTLVTQIRNKPAFERCGVSGNIHFIDSEPVARPLHRLGNIVTFGHPTALSTRNVLSWPAYLYFEHLVWRRFRDSLYAGEYDLVHRVTPISPTVPSPMAAHSPIPFLLGPINGNLPWPSESTNIWLREGEWLTPFQSCHRLLPYLRTTFERSARIFAATERVRSSLPRRARRRTVIMPENGVDLARFTPKPSRTDSQFNILFVGRLVPVKQPALILHALAQAQLPPNAATVVYVGDGPEADRIRRDTAELNLSANVDLIGSVPHEMLIRYYHGASILALPSIHESGGAVLLEAMACGVPCVTVDYGGPSTYITTNTGIKIPLCSYDKLVTTFAQAFRYLYNNPETLKHYGIAARHVVEAKFSWTRKAATMVEYYEDVLNSPPSPTNARCRHPRT